MTPPRRHQRGFALVIVLVTAALLALIGTRLTAAGRTETVIARNLTAQAEAEAAADGAIFEALFHLLAPAATAWTPGPTTHLVSVGAAKVAVEIKSEGAKPTTQSSPTALTLIARAELPSGGRATRRATVTLRPSDGARPYRIVTWDDGGEVSGF